MRVTALQATFSTKKAGGSFCRPAQVTNSIQRAIPQSLSNDTISFGNTAPSEFRENYAKGITRQELILDNNRFVVLNDIKVDRLKTNGSTIEASNIATGDLSAEKSAIKADSIKANTLSAASCTSIEVPDIKTGTLSAADSIIQAIDVEAGTVSANNAIIEASDGSIKASTLSASNNATIRTLGGSIEAGTLSADHSDIITWMGGINADTLSTNHSRIVTLGGIKTGTLSANFTDIRTWILGDIEATKELSVDHSTVKTMEGSIKAGTLIAKNSSNIIASESIRAGEVNIDSSNIECMYIETEVLSADNSNIMTSGNASIGKIEKFNNSKLYMLTKEGETDVARTLELSSIGSEVKEVVIVLKEISNFILSLGNFAITDLDNTLGKLKVYRLEGGIETLIPNSEWRKNMFNRESFIKVIRQATAAAA